MNKNEKFEVLAQQFRKETGIWPLGKSMPRGMLPQDEVNIRAEFFAYGLLHRWIPVAERLPEKHTDYWVCEKHWHGHLRWRGYWMNFFGNKTKYPNPELITHWKPIILPEGEAQSEGAEK